MKDSKELDNFNATMQKVLAVSREELQRREAAWRAERAAKKRKPKASASRDKSGANT